MNPYANEEIMWQRLKDFQREAENSRLIAQQAIPSFARMVAHLAALATRRLSRRPALGVVEPNHDGAKRVA